MFVVLEWSEEIGTVRAIGPFATSQEAEQCCKELRAAYETRCEAAEESDEASEDELEYEVLKLESV